MRPGPIRPVALAAALAGLLGAAPALAAEKGGMPHPQTWLNWVMSVQVGGRPLFHSEAFLAFAWSLVAGAILTVVSVLGTRQLSIIPRRLQSALELVVSALRGIVVSIMGPRGSEFVPFIGTLFIYIALMNLMGLVPGFMSPTSNLSITAGLAIVVFVVVQYYGFREQGPGYLKHFIAGVPPQFPYVLLAPLVFAIHLIGEMFRPVTLALRLFGNLMAEEMVVLILIGLVAGMARHWIPIPIQLPNMALGLLVSLVQAAIFSMLATVYLDGVMRHVEAEQ
ncbi:MAG TPA: F0F1 ATP synthase subunit A [Armatimonadota bacterium]|nr:F0F1 ATP synthase subunit A [Armatimonadota bacterium]